MIQPGTRKGDRNQGDNKYLCYKENNAFSNLCVSSLVSFTPLGFYYPKKKDFLMKLNRQKQKWLYFRTTTLFITRSQTKYFLLYIGYK